MVDGIDDSLADLTQAALTAMADRRSALLTSVPGGVPARDEFPGDDADYLALVGKGLSAVLRSELSLSATLARLARKVHDLRDEGEQAKTPPQIPELPNLNPVLLSDMPDGTISDQVLYWENSTTTWELLDPPTSGDMILAWNATDRLHWVPNCCGECGCGTDVPDTVSCDIQGVSFYAGCVVITSGAATASYNTIAATLGTVSLTKMSDAEKIADGYDPDRCIWKGSYSVNNESAQMYDDDICSNLVATLNGTTTVWLECVDGKWYLRSNLWASSGGTPSIGWGGFDTLGGFAGALNGHVFNNDHAGPDEFAFNGTATISW